MPYTKDEFSKMEGAIQAYLTTPLTKLQRSNLGTIRMRSHSLELEQGAWAVSQSRTSGKLTNKFRHFINLHKEREREREMTQYWGPEDGLVPPP